MIDVPLGVCQCCGHEPAVGVAAVPLVPMSITWCRTCLRAGVIPIWIAVSMAAQCGGVEHMREDVLDGLIAPTLHHFDVDIDRFLAEVAEELAELEELWTSTTTP